MTVTPTFGVTVILFLFNFCKRGVFCFSFLQDTFQPIHEVFAFLVKVIFQSIILFQRSTRELFNKGVLLPFLLVHSIVFLSCLAEERPFSIYCKLCGAFPLARERKENIHRTALAAVKRPAEFAVARRLPAHRGLVAATPR